MNLLKDEPGLLGNADFIAAHDTFDSFLTKAREIRHLLGTRAYKLDEYIRQLLIACSTPLDEAFSADTSLTGPLFTQCRLVAQGLSSEHARQDGIYPAVREYASKHPLPYQEASTRCVVYFSRLLSGYLHTQLPVLIREVWSDVEMRMDMALLDKLYDEVCGILGGEADMEELNELFAKQFLAVPLLHFAFQITSNTLAELLLERDPETSCEIIRLLLDEKADPSE